MSMQSVFIHVVAILMDWPTQSMSRQLPCSPCPCCPCNPCTCPCSPEFLGLALHKAPVPRTLPAYVKVATDLSIEIGEIDPPGVNSREGEAYTRLWLIRSHLFAEGQARGISIKVIKGTTLQQLVNFFPDSSSWTLGLGKAIYGSERTAMDQDVKDFIKKLKYVHPVELLTCFFCIFGHDSMMGTPTSYLEEHCEELRKHRIRMVNKTKIELHPATLLSSYIDNKA